MIKEPLFFVIAVSKWDLELFRIEATAKHKLRPAISESVRNVRRELYTAAYQRKQ